MFQHLVISFSLHYLSRGRLREVKNKGKFQTFSPKSCRGCLPEEVAYKRFQIKWFDLEKFGILENWSLRRDGCLREVVATGAWFECSSTVRTCYKLRALHKHVDRDFLIGYPPLIFLKTMQPAKCTCRIPTYPDFSKSEKATSSYVNVI